MLAGPLVGLMSVPALAGPEGEQVVHGSAQFTRQGNHTLIRTSDRAIINYSSFDLSRNESVRFLQPGAGSRVLNRIQSDAPTFIDGSIRANGNVYFVNNAGIVFGQNAVINVGGLFAAAGNISNRDFLAGRDRFTEVTGEVVNNGRIEAGAVGLVGHRVSNYGSIVAPEGLVTMAAGDDVYIGERGGHVFARISAPSASSEGGGVEQAGTIVARDAMLSVGDHFALAVLDSSSIRAERLTVRGGANGSAVTVAGDIDATGERGGRVDVFGDTVLIDGATIDASGRTGGGVIRIGGDYQGKGLSPTSSMTLVTSDSLLRADALTAGRGGRVIVWADGHTGFGGFISARGGALNGDGGFVEVSGKETLAYRGRTDVRAPHGRSGTLLLDPRVINIIDGPAGTYPRPDGQGILFDEDTVTITLTDGDLIEQLNLLGDGQLLLQASTDIRIQDGTRVEFTGGDSFDGLLILEAGRRIRMLGNARLDLDTGSLRMIANSDGYTPSKMDRQPGNADINMSAGSTIVTDGGTIELFLQNFGDSANLLVSTINAGDGVVRLSHTGLQGASNHHIQQVAGGAGITAGSVEITSTTGGRIGLATGTRMLLNADQLSVSSAGGNINLDLTGGTIVQGISSAGGVIDVRSGSTIDLASDVDAGSGDAILFADQITTSGGTITGARVSLEAITGRLGATDARLAVTTDLLSARAQTGVFLDTQAAGGGVMSIGDFNGLSGVTSLAGRIDVIHTGDLALDAGLIATGHGLSTDVITVAADNIVVNGGGSADAGATGGIHFTSDSFTIAGPMNMAGRSFTLDAGAGGVQVDGVFGGAFETVTIDTLGELAVNPGGRLETTGTLTTTALTYNIAGGDGLNGDSALTVLARQGLVADLPFLAELETGGTLTIRALDGDLTIGGQAGVFGVASGVILSATESVHLQGADPTLYQFNDVSIAAGTGIEFTAGVTGLTSAGGVLLDAGNDSDINILQPAQFTITAGAPGTTLNSGVIAAGDLRFVGTVDAQAFDGLPSRGAPTIVFDIGGTLAFDNGLDATGLNVEIRAQNGTLGGDLTALDLLLINDVFSVGDVDRGGFLVSNDFLSHVRAASLRLGEAGREADQVWIDDLSANDPAFNAQFTITSGLIDVLGLDSQVDNLSLIALDRILIDGVSLEITGLGENLRLEAPGGVIMNGGALLGTNIGLIDLHSDVSGTGDATFDSVLRINGLGLRSITRDTLVTGTIRFAQDVLAAGGQGLLVDAADGMITFGNGFVGQGGAFASIELAAGGGIFADTSLVLVSNGSVTTRDDVTANGRIDIVVDADGTADGTDQGTFEGLNSNAGAGTAGITVTNGLADLGHTTLVFNGLLRSSGATNDGIIVNAGVGSVDLLGGVQSNGGLFRSEASLTTLSSDIDTAGGNATIGDGLLVDGTRFITTADGAFEVGGLTVIDGSLDVNTVGVGGGNAIFRGAVVGSAPGGGTLRLDLGTGDAIFDGPVGRTGEDRHLALFEITLADEVFLGGGIYEATTISINANTLRVDMAGGGSTEFRTRGGAMDFMGGGFSLAAGNDLLLTALEGGNVTVSGVFADVDNDSTLTARVLDNISITDIGLVGARLALVDLEANLAEIKGQAHADRFIFTADQTDFLGGVGSVHGREMTLVQRTDTRGINIGGNGSDATRLNITQADIDAMADGFAVVRIGNNETQNLRVLNNPGSQPVVIRDPFELRTETSVSVLGNINGLGDAALRVLSGVSTLLDANVTLNTGDLIFTNLSGAAGQVVIRGPVELRTGGGLVSMAGPLDGDPNATNVLLIDAGDGRVVVGKLGDVASLDQFTLLGGQIEIDRIGTSTKAGVRGATRIEASDSLTFLGSVYNTGPARYSAADGMTADRTVTFVTGDNNIVFGSNAGVGRGGITFGLDNNWIVNAGTGTIGLDGVYTGNDSNMLLTGSRIILNGDTVITNPNGFVDFVGRLVGNQMLDIALTTGRVRFREVGANNDTDRLGAVDVAAGRIDFTGGRFDAESARFAADTYEMLPSTALPVQTIAARSGLTFDGGEIRFRSGQLFLTAVEGAVELASVRGGANASALVVNGRDMVRLAGVGASNSSGVDTLFVNADELAIDGDLFVRERSMLRPFTEGGLIRVGSAFVAGNGVLEISQAMLDRFVSTLPTSSISIGGVPSLNDLESDVTNFSDSRIQIRDIAIDHQISFFGSSIDILSGSTLRMVDGAGVRVSATGVSRLLGDIVSEGGTVVVNGERAILGSLIDSNGGDIIIRSQNAFVDQGAELSTLGAARDGDFVVDGGVDGLVAGEGDFVLNVGRGSITLAPGRGFGQTRRLRSVDLTANVLELTNVLTTGEQRFTGVERLQLNGGQLDSLSGNIRFSNDIRVDGTQFVRVGDGTIFLPGDIVAGTSSKTVERVLVLETGAGGHAEFRGDASGVDGLIVDTDAVVFGDRTFAGGDILFLGSVESGAGKVDLVIDADGTAQLAGNVGADSPFRSVRVAAGDLILLGASGESIRIETCGLQEFDGQTRIAGDLFLQATGFDGEVSRQDSIVFTGDIFATTAGADSLTAIVDRTTGVSVNGDTPPTNVPIIAFGGNIGTRAVPLAELNLNFAAGGEIDGRVNAAGEAFASTVATILFGDLDAFMASGTLGDFGVFANQMNTGRGEALTVVGSVNFEGVRGRVSDVSTLGDMRFAFSDQLTIANRAPGETFDTITETFTDDEGADLVSNGSITILTPRLVIDNDGLADPGLVSIAARGANVQFSGGLSLPSGVNLRSLPDGTDALYVFDLNTIPGGAGEALLSDRFLALDVRAAGPSNTNIAEAIAGAVQNADSGQVESGTVVEATIRDILAELGLEPRGYAVDYLDNDEARAIVTETMLGALDGAGLFVDVRNIDGRGGIETTIERLDRNLTAQVVGWYQDLWYGPRDDDGRLLAPSSPAGVVEAYDRSQDQSAAILAAFERVTTDCRTWLQTHDPEAAAEREIPADQWMNFLIERQAEYPAATQYVIELERLMRGLRSMGLSADELGRVWEVRLVDAIPAGVDRAGLRALLTGERELEMATNADFNGRAPVIEME